MNDFNNDSNKKDKNIIGKIKSSFSGRKFRSGVYVTMLSLIVIVIVVVVNMILSKLDLKVDVSSQNFYTLTNDTKTIVKDVKDDVIIYFMAEESKQDEQVQKIAEKYDSLSNHIKLISKDPVLYPNFATQYGIKDKISENSFIVVNKTKNRAKYIAYNDLFIQEVDPSTYQNQTTGIDVEGKLTSAIQYVTTDKLPIMYVVQGHGETEIGSVFKSNMLKQNVKVKTLQTLTEQSIPKNCNMLFINIPTSDLSKDELTMIKDYMAAGGNVILNVNYKFKELTNYYELLNYYGLEVVDGIIVEADSSMYIPKYPIALIPKMESNDITKSAIDNKVLTIMARSSGLKALDNVRSSLKISPLLTTSDQSYSKVNLNAQTISKENGDIEGPFNVGVLATDTYKQVVSNMVVYSSDGISAAGSFSDDLLKEYGNNNILSGTVGYLAGNTASLSIPSKSLKAQSLKLTAKDVIVWGTLVVVIIPVIILIVGFVVWYLRRRK